jgi:carbamoylphosphate synthase large subunit
MCSPTLGGQTALNCACNLFDDGTLAEFGVEMIGANREIIHRAEDRQAVQGHLREHRPQAAEGQDRHHLEDALAFLKEIGLPAIIRPAFTLGGSAAASPTTATSSTTSSRRGLAASMIGAGPDRPVVIGWKEYELEVVRDKQGQLHHRLRHREHRSDGRPHRRLDHRRADPDADRQGIPGDARRRDRHHARRRRRDRRFSNVQFAVNPNPSRDRTAKRWSWSR